MVPMKGLRIIRPLGKGKRGIVHLVQWKNKRAVLKTTAPKSMAIKRLANEAAWLQRLNARGIGPRLYAFSEDAGNERLVMEYIEGIPFEEYLETCTLPKRRAVTLSIFDQCRVMDTLNVTKYEMHKPVKHILVRGDRPVLIDFERCTITLRPKNVTQFADYLVRLGFSHDKCTLLLSLRRYKKEYSERAYRDVISSFSL